MTAPLLNRNNILFKAKLSTNPIGKDLPEDFRYVIAPGVIPAFDNRDPRARFQDFRVKMAESYKLGMCSSIISLDTLISGIPTMGPAVLGALGALRSLRVEDEFDGQRWDELLQCIRTENYMHPHMVTYNINFAVRILDMFMYGFEKFITPNADCSQFPRYVAGKEIHLKGKSFQRRDLLMVYDALEHITNVYRLILLGQTEIEDDHKKPFTAGRKAYDILRACDSEEGTLKLMTDLCSHLAQNSLALISIRNTDKLVKLDQMELPELRNRIHNWYVRHAVTLV